MWFFSSDPSKNFAYEIGEKVPGQEDTCLWALHQGKHKVCSKNSVKFVKRTDELRITCYSC